MHQQSRFWDALAPHHAALEDNYLDVASLRSIMGDARSRVLVVGAGQGLLVAELRSKGFKCDGVDFSSEMIRHAKCRRGIHLLQADASALVAFYRLSPALEGFLATVGLLSNSVVLHRRSMETYMLTPAQMIRWTMKNARTGWWRAVALMSRLAVCGTIREKTTTLKMQRIVRKMKNPQAFIQAASDTQPYRNEAEIRRLFDRLNIPIQGIRALATCWVVQA